jgi:hypothetical protein
LVSCSLLTGVRLGIGCIDLHEQKAQKTIQQYNNPVIEVIFVKKLDRNVQFHLARHQGVFQSRQHADPHHLGQHRRVFNAAVGEADTASFRRA